MNHAFCIAKDIITAERAAYGHLQLQGTCSGPADVCLRHVVYETRRSVVIKPGA
jgi:hypothetical protein